LPDFVKLAEAFGGVGLRAEKPSEMDDVIEEMLAATSHASSMSASTRPRTVSP
jgi:thiamine pyrophosphate-dependent acetolactate synthase large subunit-like protein